MSLASDTPPAIHLPHSSWSHVVIAGPSSPPPEAADRSPERAEGSGDSISQAWKPAWNRPSSNVGIEVVAAAAVAAGPVMGAESWPALSESTRIASKSSALNSPPVAVIASASKPNTNNLSPSDAIPNHAGRAPARQKSMKHVGAGGPVPPLSLPGTVEVPPAALDKQDGAEPSPKVSPSRGNSNWDSGSRGGGISMQSHIEGDHHRGSGGGNRRGGGGSHHGGFGNRRDWNPPRSFGGRDVHVPPQQHRGHPPPFLRSPPPSTVPGPFINPPPLVRPFVNPMGFPDIPSPVYLVPGPPPPESLRGMPFVAHPVPHAMPPPMFIPAPDHQRAMLVMQIDYYFSSENLCKDIYLRQNMDELGWVPISLIAGFNRVKQITNNVQYILDAVRSSTIVEVQGEKIRRRNDWMNWILSPSLSQQVSTSPRSLATPNNDVMAARMQGLRLEEGNIKSPAM